jgi:hypothetical protein
MVTVANELSEKNQPSGNSKTCRQITGMGQQPVDKLLKTSQQHGALRAADRLSSIAVLFPASRLISGAVNRSRDGDAASERGRFGGQWNHDCNGRRRVFLGGFFGDEKCPKGSRHLVNQARYEAAKAHAVQDPFGLSEDSNTQLARQYSRIRYSQS